MEWRLYNDLLHASVYVCIYIQLLRLHTYTMYKCMCIPVWVQALVCILQCICVAWIRACSVRLKITQAIYAQVLSSGNYLSLKKFV